MELLLSRKTGSLFVVVVAQLLCGVAVAQEEKPAETSSKEQEEIEKALSADAAANKQKEGQREIGVAPSSQPSGGFGLQSLNPDMSFIADVAAAGFSQLNPLQTGEHDPKANGFTLQQVELGVSKSVDPYFNFNSFIVFRQESVEVEEVYATTTSLPGRLQVRAGQFLTQFGRLNPTHPHTWNFVDQVLPIGRIFGGDGSRGLGGEVSWLTPLPWFVEVIGSVTEATGQSTALSFLSDVDRPIHSPLDLLGTGAVKQFFPFSDDLSLLWGLSGATGPNPTGVHTRTDIYGTDVYLKYRPISDPGNPTMVTLQSELFYRRREIPDDLLQDWNLYAELFYRFALRWGVAGRYEWGTPTTNLAGHAVPDPTLPQWFGTGQRVSANVTFWPTEFSRIRLQTAGEFFEWRPQPDYSVMVAFEFAVGAHGAHKF